MNSHETSLRSPRLDLVATTLAHVEAELLSPDALAPLLGVTVPPTWPPGEYDRQAIEFFRDRLMAGGPSHVGWYGWYAISLDSLGRRDTLIAGAGYFGPPVDGSVEIGYSVVPEARGLGYATELVEALVSHAFEYPAVRCVIAHTSDSNPASSQVLRKTGFSRVGPGEAPESVKYRRDRIKAP